jgi:hypothetical protein
VAAHAMVASPSAVQAGLQTELQERD